MNEIRNLGFRISDFGFGKTGRIGIMLCYRGDKNPDALAWRIDDAVRGISHLNGQLVALPSESHAGKKSDARNT